VAELVGERRALEIIPPRDDFGIQADQKCPRQRRVGLRYTERVAPLGIPDAAIEIPARGDLDAVDPNLLCRPNQSIDVDAEHGPAPQRLLAYLIGDAPDLPRRQRTGLHAAAVVGIADPECHRRLPEA
jgi:hypothetical protein